jgi:hypothetical protein
MQGPIPPDSGRPGIPRDPLTDRVGPAGADVTQIGRAAETGQLAANGIRQRVQGSPPPPGSARRGAPNGVSS